MGWQVVVPVAGLRMLPAAAVWHTRTTARLLPACSPAHPLACLPACLPVRLPARLIARLPFCLPARQVQPTSFGVVDDHSMFVAFEGRATEHTPLFKVGVSLAACCKWVRVQVRVRVRAGTWVGM